MPICVVSSNFDHPIHQAPNKSQWQNKLFDTGREDMANFSWAQPTYSALLLIPQMHVPYKCGTIKREINRLSNGIRFIAKKHCYDKEIINQTQISLLFVLSLYCTACVCKPIGINKTLPHIIKFLYTVMKTPFNQLIK